MEDDEVIKIIYEFGERIETQEKFDEIINTLLAAIKKQPKEEETDGSKPL